MDESVEDNALTEDPFTPETGVEDPFHKDNVGTVNAIMLMRIYDVLMGLYTETNPAAAHALLEMHTDGIIFGPMPSLSGQFITNEVDDGTRSYNSTGEPEIDTEM